LKNSRLDETYRGIFESISEIRAEMKAEKRESRRLILGFLSLLLICFLIIPCKLLLVGWISSVLWGWFVVPIFNLAPISFLQASGIILLVSFLANFKDQLPVSLKEKDDASPNRPPREKLNENLKKLRRALLEIIVGRFFASIIVLVMGWIIHFFI
jgi:hypothetical protein